MSGPGEREILPARMYSLPSTSKRSFLALSSFDEFSKIINIGSFSTIDKQISDNFIGVSRGFINNLLKQETTLETIYIRLKEITNNIDKLHFEKIETDYFPVLVQDKENLYNNFFLDDFYYEKEQQETFILKRNNLLMRLQTELKKYTKRLENINNKLKDCGNMDTYRIYGELITSNLYRFPNTNLSSVTVQNYYDENNELVIQLDKKYSVSKNAALFFKKYNKLKNTLEIVSIQKKETELELEYLESILFSIENSKTYLDLEEIEKEMEDSSIFQTHKNTSAKANNKQDISEPMKFEFEGYTILAGKNNKQNDLLTLKIANRNDLWFHTQKVQGSHVVLKTEGKTVPNEVIEYCANIAKENSKAKNSTNVAVDYCEVKHVKKPTGAKPGMVIYKEFKTIIVK